MPHDYVPHPAIQYAIKQKQVALQAAGIILAECPMLSEDGVRVAHYRSEEHRSQDRRTVCPLQRYLQRNLGIPEQDAQAINAWWIKQFAASRPTASICKLVQDAEMVAVMLLPSIEYHDADAALLFCPSCMADEREYWSTPERHPYQAYSSRLGWAMAIRMEDGKVMARAIVHTAQDGTKRHGRVYGPATKDKRAYASDGDAILEAWMTEQGIAPAHDLFKGCKLDAIEWDSDQFIAPYVDSKIPSHGIMALEKLGLEYTNGYFLITPGGWVDTDGFVTTIELYDGSIYLGDRNDLCWIHDGKFALQRDCTQLATGDWALDCDVVIDYRGNAIRKVESITLVSGDVVHGDEDGIARLSNGEWAWTNQTCETIHGNVELKAVCTRLDDGGWCLDSEVIRWSDGSLHHESDPEPATDETESEESHA